MEQKHNDSQVHRQPLPSYNTQSWTQLQDIWYTFLACLKRNMFSQISTVEIRAGAQHHIHVWNTIPGEGVQAQLHDLSQPPIRAMNLQLD